MTDNGSPEPEFHTDDDRTHFLTVLPANMEAYEDETDEDTIDAPDGGAIGGAIESLNERQKKAIEYVKERGSITNSEYKSLFAITDRTALRDLNSLVGKNILSKSGNKKSTTYTLI